jgi:hypothetical protein
LLALLQKKNKAFLIPVGTTPDIFAPLRRSPGIQDRFS